MVSERELYMRPARREDLPEIVKMLADDELGKTREHNTAPIPDTYIKAFEAIELDRNHELVVACLDDQIAGVLQLNILQNLTHEGSKRALIEGVRVAHNHRSQGIGRFMFEWAIDRASQHQCKIIQLTTDKSRPDALRFYQTMGFVASHEGMKLTIK